MVANSGHLDVAVIVNCASLLNGFVVLSLARAPFFSFVFSVPHKHIIFMFFLHTCQRYDPHWWSPKTYTQNGIKALQKASCTQSSISCLFLNKTQWLFLWSPEAWGSVFLLTCTHIQRLRGSSYKTFIFNTHFFSMELTNTNRLQIIVQY